MENTLPNINDIFESFSEDSDDLSSHHSAESINTANGNKYNNQEQYYEAHGWPSVSCPIQGLVSPGAEAQASYDLTSEAASELGNPQVS